MLTAEQLFEKNTRIAYDYVWSHGSLSIPGYEQEDFFQVALMGLWKACLTYDPTKSEFSTYATTCIMNEIKMLKRHEKGRGKINNALSLDSLAENTETGLHPDFNAPRVESFEEVLTEMIDAENVSLTNDEKVLLNMKKYMNDSEIRRLCHVSGRRMKKIRMKAKEHGEQ